MNPETEDLIFGKDLVEGMVVLIEEPVHRMPKQIMHLAPTMKMIEDGEKAKIRNRWCRVSSLNFESDTVIFIGEYAEGNKHIRVYSEYDGWLVKKDSVPKKPSSYNDNYKRCRDLVKHAMLGDGCTIISEPILTQTASALASMMTEAGL